MRRWDWPLWLCIVAYVSCLFGFVFIVAARAEAPPGTDPNSPLAKWFKSVEHPRYGRCCDIGDGRFVQAEKIPGGWRVLLDNRWENVPPDTVLNEEPNPTGFPVVWLNHGTDTIRCFLPIGSGV